MVLSIHRSGMTIMYYWICSTWRGPSNQPSCQLELCSADVVSSFNSYMTFHSCSNPNHPTQLHLLINPFQQLLHQITFPPELLNRVVKILILNLTNCRLQFFSPPELVNRVVEYQNSKCQCQNWKKSITHLTDYDQVDQFARNQAKLRTIQLQV